MSRPEISDVVKDCLHNVNNGKKGEWQLDAEHTLYCCKENVYCPRRYLATFEQPLQNCDDSAHGYRRNEND